MNWNDIVTRVTPYIVGIDTPDGDGYGTGFLCFYNPTKTLVGIATAHHVIAHAEEWQHPIRLRHFPTKKSEFLKEGDRVIFSDEKTDSAVILMTVEHLDLPETPIPLLPISIPLNVGTEVGWLGYPSVAVSTLCFFSGIVSAWQDWRHSYLLDGEAISGVSGGPVLYSHTVDGPQIVGTVSAYISNKTTPGLAMAHDMTHFHAIINHVKDLHEARERKRAQEEEQARKQPAQPEQETEPTPGPQ